VKLYHDENVPDDASDEHREVYLKLPGNEDFETMLDKCGGKLINDHILHFPVNGTKTVILIAGGRGALEIRTDWDFPAGHLVPSSLVPHFQEQGYNVTLVHSGDYPLPWLINVLFSKIPGLVLNDRFQLPKVWMEKNATFNLKRALHAVHVISKELKRAVDMSDVPVWLMGQCSSNYIMSRYYHHFQDTSPIEGLIFSAVNSPPTQLGKYAKNYYDRCNFFRRDQRVTVPLHIIHHELDISDYTDIPTCQLILDQFEFVQSSLNIVSGGYNEGHPKMNFGHHGFRGIEQEIAHLSIKLMNSIDN
jgi:hypothetical protein